MKRSQLKILVVDDEPAMREVLEARLEVWGHQVRCAATGGEARATLEQWSPDAAISDVVLPDTSGLDLLHSLRAGDDERPIVLMTAYGTIDTAVEAMKRGARDFLTKPLDYAQLKAILDAIFEEIELRRSTDRLAHELDNEAGLGPLVGHSAPQRELYGLLRTLGDSDASVIITGESGTGKELVARTIHQLSARRDGPFVAVNAAAIPEGLTEGELLGHERGAFTGAVAARAGFYEQAEGGTLFLDEITEMPISLQPKFLRVLEDGCVRRVGGNKEVQCNVRSIAATNRQPELAVESGLLRADLYYRLNVFTVTLAPLRKRKQDIPLLAQHFIQRANKRHNTRALGLRPQTLAQLHAHDWPGNVRELNNTIERAVILSRDSWIEPLHLPPLIQRISEPDVESDTPVEGIVLPVGVTSAEAERILILETLKQTDNNKAETARRLGLDVKTIRNKLKAFARADEGAGDPRGAASNR